MPSRILAHALIVLLIPFIDLPPGARAAADPPSSVFLSAADFFPADSATIKTPGQPARYELRFSVATTSRVPTNLVRANFSIAKVSNKAGINFYPPAGTGSVLLKGGGVSNTVSLPFSVNETNAASGKLVYLLTLDSLEVPEGLNVTMISPIEFRVTLAVAAPGTH